MKEVDISVPIKKQKNYNNDYARYWTKPVLEINGRHYILCSQWFKSFQPKLDNWILENANNKKFSKRNVYIVSKKEIKTCSTCNERTEKDFLFITYHTSIADIENRLFARKCPKCKKIYIADTIFKTYSQNKNLENMDINFIR